MRGATRRSRTRSGRPARLAALLLAMLLGAGLGLAPAAPGRAQDAEERAKVPHLDEKVALWRCKSCGKLYWEGSHWKKIKERMEGG